MKRYLALAALALVATMPAHAAPFAIGGAAFEMKAFDPFEARPEMAAMQPGTDSGSSVGDRAGQVRPGDLKTGGVRNGGDTGQKPTPRAVDARKTSDSGPIADWRAHLAPS